MADVAKRAGIKVFAVGFGSADKETIISMASEPSEVYAVSVDSMSQAPVQILREHFANGQFCQLAASPSPPPTNLAAAAVAEAAAPPPPPPPNLSPPSPHLLPPSFPPIEKECERMLDVVLVLDDSGSMGIVEAEAKKFAKKLVDSFVVSEAAAKFAVVTFNRRPCCGRS